MSDAFIDDSDDDANAHMKAQGSDDEWTPDDTVTPKKKARGRARAKKKKNVTPSPSTKATQRRIKRTARTSKLGRSKEKDKALSDSDYKPESSASEGYATASEGDASNSDEESFDCSNSEPEWKPSRRERTGRKAAESDSESEASVGSASSYSSEEKDSPPVPQSRRPKRPARKPVEESDVSSDDNEDSDKEPPAPRRRSQRKATKHKVVQESDSSDDASGSDKSSVASPFRSDNQRVSGRRARQQSSAMTRRARLIIQESSGASSSSDESNDSTCSDQIVTAKGDEEPVFSTPTASSERGTRGSSDESSESESDGALGESPASKLTPKRTRKRKSLVSPEMERKRARKQKLQARRQRIEARREAEELKKDLAFMERKPAAKQRNDDDTPDDYPKGQEAAPPPYLVSCSTCNTTAHMVTRTTNADDKLFYTCTYCNHFYWPRDALRHLRDGPPCDCGQPSYPRCYKGKWEFVCSNTNANPCAFELDAEVVEGHAGAEDDRADNSMTKSATSSDQQFLVGDNTRQKLQALFDVPPEDKHELGRGRDASGLVPREYYDHLQVERAWRVDSPAEHVHMFDEFRTSIGQHLQGRAQTELRPEYSRAVEALAEAERAYLEPLQRDANELLLIHGTKPEVVASILSKNLDPNLARPGLFGKGTYFAEHAAKIDQYATVDKEYCGGRREERYGTLCELHNKLFPRPEMHPGSACYALVCRVVFGDPDVTTISKNSPANGRHSLLAELGGTISRFREFVVFDRYAIKIEYVVCFTRTRHYCYCNPPVPVRKRTFYDQGLGEQRDCICCDNSYRDPVKGYVGGCGLFSALPRCYCPRIDRKPDFYGADCDGSRGHFHCRKNRCLFKQLVEQGVDLREPEDSDQNEDDFDYDDGFLVRG